MTEIEFLPHAFRDGDEDLGATRILSHGFHGLVDAEAAIDKVEAVS